MYNMFISSISLRYKVLSRTSPIPYSLIHNFTILSNGTGNEKIDITNIFIPFIFSDELTWEIKKDFPR